MMHEWACGTHFRLGLGLDCLFHNVTDTGLTFGFSYFENLSDCNLTSNKKEINKLFALVMTL